jgi:hypothetical protein
MRVTFLLQKPDTGLIRIQPSEHFRDRWQVDDFALVFSANIPNPWGKVWDAQIKAKRGKHRDGNTYALSAEIRLLAIARSPTHELELKTSSGKIVYNLNPCEGFLVLPGKEVRKEWMTIIVTKA